VPGKDGKQIFAYGGQSRGELVRYDPHSGRAEPFLSGISAEQLDFSRDGKRVAYVTFPEGILWCSKIDGTEKIPLTNSSLYAGVPHWSPDGTRIAFAAAPPGGLWKVYVVSAQGGNPQMVTHGPNDELDPTWSPDGDTLIFGQFVRTPGMRIYSVNLRTGRVSTIPGSEGMFSPRMSPDGRFIAATDSAEGVKLLLFDRNSQKWSLVAEDKNFGGGWQVWSNDSRTCIPRLPMTLEN
jgi:Tol biopolymer transport system component